MTMPPPLATATARSTAAPERRTGLDLGGNAVAVGAEPGAGVAAPLELLASAAAACAALAARAQLDRIGERGDVEVVVSLDAGPPPVLYRRVLLGFRLDPADARGLVDALERAQVATMLRPALTIRTQIEHDGDTLA